MYLDGENRRSLTPQLAFRVALIGGVALVAFGVIFFRLWYLQVLSGDQYEAKANDNRVREIKVQAPRGEVVDRDGRVLVDNRTGLAVKVTPGKLPDGKAERMELYRRLAARAGLERGPDRPKRLRPAQGAALLGGHRQAGRQAQRGRLPARAPEGVPRRDRGARVPAPVPPPADRRPPVRHRGRDHQGAAQGPALPRRGPGRPRGPVGHRVPVRPLPARQERRLARAGRRAGQPQGRALGAAPGAGPPAAPVGGPRRPAGRASRRWAGPRARSRS